jgi:hypothetical protein
MPPRHTIRQVVGTYRRKAFGTRNPDGSDRRPPYPADAIVAFYGMLELAEEQPTRGVFESEALLRVLLEGPEGKGRRFARHVPYLIEQGDLTPGERGQLVVEGWQVLQEGSAESIHDRMGRFNGRERPMTGAERQAAYRARKAEEEAAAQAAGGPEWMAGGDADSDARRDADRDEAVTVTK